MGWPNRRQLDNTGRAHNAAAGNGHWPIGHGGKEKTVQHTFGPLPSSHPFTATSRDPFALVTAENGGKVWAQVNSRKETQNVLGKTDDERGIKPKSPFSESYDNSRFYVFYRAKNHIFGKIGITRVFDWALGHAETLMGM